MRELVVENQEVLLIPQNFKFANRGKVSSVRAGDFTHKQVMVNSTLILMPRKLTAKP